MTKKAKIFWANSKNKRGWWAFVDGKTYHLNHHSIRATDKMLKEALQEHNDIGHLAEDFIIIRPTARESIWDRK